MYQDVFEESVSAAVRTLGIFWRNHSVRDPFDDHHSYR
jgi:hypothetical protein